MILTIFHFAKRLLGKCLSYLFSRSRINRRKVLSRRSLSNLLSITANVRKTYSNLHLNNCVQSKCKHASCVKPQSSAVSSKKSKIPKAILPHTKQTSVKPDVPSLIMLLQAVGFQLREFEKQEQTKEENVDSKESIKVIIQCGSSQMKAVLEMDGIECHCPSSNAAKGGSLWSICGTGPNNNDSVKNSKYEETGSNLLPTIPKGVNNVVRDVVYRLFKIMNNPTSLATANSGNDLNVSALGNIEDTTSSNLQKSESKERIFRSHTQPSIPSIQLRSSNNKLLASKNLYRSTVNENDGKISKFAKSTGMSEETLRRQRTWHMDLDIDSGTTSPSNMFNSSTLEDQMSDSLGKLSLTSEDEKLGPGDFVLKAYVYLDKAVCIMSNIKRNAKTESTEDVNNEFFDYIPIINTPTIASSSPKPASRSGSVCSATGLSFIKANPQKPPSRRSVPASIYRKSSEKLPIASRGEMTTTPLQRRSFNTNTGPQKTIPSRQAPLKTRNTLTSSMNTTTLSDKVVFSAKKRVSPNIKSSPMVPKKSTFGPNTSLKVPNTSKPISLTSNGTPGTSRFGYPKNK